MTDLVNEVVWSGYAADLVIKTTLILGAAAIVAFVLRRGSAATRHMVWTVSVVGLVALPLLAVLLPAWTIPVSFPRTPPPAETWSPAGGPAALTAGATVPRMADAAIGTTAGTTAGTTSEGAPPPVTRGSTPLAPSPPTRAPVPWPIVLLGVWGAGIVLLLLRRLLGRLGLRRLYRGAKHISDPEWNRVLKDAAWLQDVGRPVELMRSVRTSMPMTWGTLRPVILLPEEADKWPEERRRVVLLHEMAHVARRDCLTQTLADLACAIYWFHPLAWIAARRLRAERERACDDRVLTAGERASDYASHLLEVARTYRAVGGFGGAAIAMARPSQLEGRLLAVLDGGRSRQAPGRRARMLGITLAALLLLPIASIRSGDAQAGEGSGYPGSSASPESETWVRSVIVDNGQPVQDAGTSFAFSVAEGGIELGVTARPGGMVRIDLSNGADLRIAGWARDSVAMRAVLHGGDESGVRIELVEIDGGVGLRADNTAGYRGQTPTIELRVPSRSDIMIQSAGGDVSIDGVAGLFSGRTRGGDVVLRRMTGESTLRTDGGDLFVSASELAGTVETYGGDVVIVDNQGNLNGSTDGGDIRIENSAGGSFSGASVAELLRLTSGGGDIDLLDVPGGAELTTGGGDIDVRSARGPIIAQTGGGDIWIERVGGVADLRTRGGDIEIASAAGPVRIVSGDGDVSVAVVAGGGSQHIQIDAGDGEVDLTLPADFQADFDIELGSYGGREDGRLSSDFELTRAASSQGGSVLRATGRTGTGANRVEIRTSSGEVRIRRSAGGAALSGQAALGPSPDPWPDPDSFERMVEDAVQAGLHSGADAILNSDDVGAWIADLTTFISRETVVAVSQSLDAAASELQQVADDIQVDVDFDEHHRNAEAHPPPP